MVDGFTGQISINTSGLRFRMCDFFDKISRKIIDKDPQGACHHDF